MNGSPLEKVPFGGSDWLACGVSWSCTVGRLSFRSKKHGVILYGFPARRVFATGGEHSADGTLSKEALAAQTQNRSLSYANRSRSAMSSALHAASGDHVSDVQVVRRLDLRPKPFVHQSQPLCHGVTVFSCLNLFAYGAPELFPGNPGSNSRPLVLQHRPIDH